MKSYPELQKCVGSLKNHLEFWDLNINSSYLNVSAWLLPVSAVLDGFVLESKLNVLGLSECGDAVVEFAIQFLESDSCVGIVVAVLFVELELFGWPLPHNERVVAVLFGWLTCPSAIAIGLGDESGDEVSDDTFWRRKKGNIL